MEEEARAILCDAVAGRQTRFRDLAEFTRECFAPLGGIGLEIPPRGPMARASRLFLGKLFYTIPEPGGISRNGVFSYQRR